MDWTANLIVLAIAAVTILFLSSRKMSASATWQATVTPLASIIGSGFLIVAPLLGFTIGKWSVAAMLCIVVVSYLVGSGIRFNIANEPRRGTLLGQVDRLASLVLAFAYVIAIAFYLELLGAFALRLVHIEAESLQKILASALVLGIGVYGAIRGLGGLEKIEEAAVDIKLAVIAALLGGLAFHNGEMILQGSWSLPSAAAQIDVDTIRKLLGAFLIVQGFETSRYLANAYDAPGRIRTMRYSQLVSGTIYVAFIALSTVMMAHFENITETGIIDMTEEVALVLPYMLMVGAIMSQFSAAIADTIASGGLVEEETFGAVKSNQVYLVASGIVIVLLWTANIFEVIAYASRAFALYYALQCGIAAVTAAQRGNAKSDKARAAGFVCLTLLMLLVTVFAIPVETAGN